jgi:Uma2 family endonuclease
MSGVAMKLDRPATEADLLALPDEGRGYELIDGVLVEKQAGFGHGRAHVQLGHLLAPFDRGSRRGDGPRGWWILMEQAVRFAAGQTLRPDMAGWRREHLPRPPAHEDTVIHVRPDWIGEIVSPSNARNDLIKKRRIYYKHGVPHYWIIDPRDESLTVLRWTPDGYVEALVAERGERVRPEPFDAVEWDVGVLFGEDDDDEPRSEG